MCPKCFLLSIGRSSSRVFSSLCFFPGTKVQNGKGPQGECMLGKQSSNGYINNPLSVHGPNKVYKVAHILSNLTITSFLWSGRTITIPFYRWGEWKSREIGGMRVGVPFKQRGGRVRVDHSQLVWNWKGLGGEGKCVWVMPEVILASSALLTFIFVLLNTFPSYSAFAQNSLVYEMLPFCLECISKSSL